MVQMKLVLKRGWDKKVRTVSLNLWILARLRIAIDSSGCRAYNTYRMNMGHTEANNKKETLKAYALPAFFVFPSSLLAVSLLVFFASMTANRSKSFKFLRASTDARFFAQLDSVHFATVPSFSSFFLMMPVPAARGRFGSL
jgi:hypothetical protein